VTFSSFSFFLALLASRSRFFTAFCSSFSA
jgi:hypothetical protein